MKAWLEWGAAASQMVTRPGMTSGQIEIPSPAKVSANRIRDQRNGAQSRSPPRLRQPNAELL